MSKTDKNNFDDYLKDNLFRDMVFRTIIWLTFSLVAAYIAIYDNNEDAINYFINLTKKFTPLLNTIGFLAIHLCILALLLKDIEASQEAEK